MFTIIDKITCVENSLIYRDFGYTQSDSLINEINSNYEITLGDFLKTNLNALESGDVFISDFFKVVSFVYVARTIVTEKGDLPKIENMEGL